MDGPARRGEGEHEGNTGLGDQHERRIEVVPKVSSQTAVSFSRSCCVLVLLVHSGLLLCIYRQKFSDPRYWDATPELISFGDGIINASTKAHSSERNYSQPEFIFSTRNASAKNHNLQQKKTRGTRPLDQQISVGSSSKHSGNLSRSRHPGSVLTSPSRAKDRKQERKTKPTPKTGNFSSSQRCTQQDVVGLAKCMHASIGSVQTSTDFLLVMMGNKAFLPFIYNWLCNTAHMEGVHERTLLLFSDDGDQAFKSSAFGVQALQVDRSLEQEFQASQDYDSFGYWLLVQLRVQVIVRLIDAGVPFLLCEPDALWVQNPLDDPALRTSADLVGFDDHNGIPGFGFMRVRPSTGVRLLFHEMEQQYSAQMPKLRKAAHARFHVDGEQNILHRLLENKRSKPYKDLTFQMLSRHKYVSGKWYDGGRGGDGRGVRDSCRKHGMPYVINNNWIVGNGPKITRARRWGHWFLQGEGEGSGAASAAAACPNSGRLHHQIQQMHVTMKFLAPLHGPPKPNECPRC